MRYLVLVLGWASLTFVPGCRDDSARPGVDAGFAIPDGGIPLTAAVLARTCAMVISCPLWPPEYRGSVCVGDFEQGLSSFSGPFIGTAAQLQQYVDCTAAGSTCADVLGCVSHGDGAGYCLANYGQSCDGNLETVCASSVVLTTDCAALGDQCYADAQGHAVCTNGVVCDPLTARDACDGNRWTRCDPDTHHESSLDCKDLHVGAFCGSYKGSDGCIPDGPPCDGFGPVPLRCDGNSLVTCVWGHEFPVDCTASEAHCVDQGFSSACVYDATDCNAGAPDQCDGDSLRICVNGHFETVNCTTIGLRTCIATPAVVADMGGTAATAKCVP